jgi:DNA topoisomerase-1
MRTDSVKIASSAIRNARNFISKNLGKQYLPPAPVTYRSRKTAQEAHESIRPTNIHRVPEKIKEALTKDQFSLYSLIWRRFISCQMNPALIRTVSVDMECGNYGFRISGQNLIFDGYTRIWDTRIKQDTIPRMNRGDRFVFTRLESPLHQTQPPARFTPATLVSELEKNGIGRPSTYAAIINTLFKRKYVVSENGALVPQEIGEVVVDVLTRHFSRIMDIKFTALLEDSLDEIARGKQRWINMIEEFYGKFDNQYKKATVTMEKIKDEKTDVRCPSCGSPMVLRWGRNGRFLACTAFPKCRKTLTTDENGNMIKEENTRIRCPKCFSPMVMKGGRYGRFLACSTYPECRATLAVDKEGNIINIPLGYERCPECGKDTTIRVGPKGKFLACTGYPKCRFSMSLKKTE